MLKRNQVMFSLALMGLYAYAAPAVAATVAESGVASEVNACIAEVRDRLDYSDATRVHHDITAIERRTVGYTLKISTSIFSESDSQAIRAYAATCIVNGNNPPLSFSMSESS